MYSLNGLINGNAIITSENLYAYEGRKVIITILDDTFETLNSITQTALTSKRKAAARELAGIWNSYDAAENVDEMLRNFRKERRFAGSLTPNLTLS